MAASTTLTPSLEDYLEVIFHLVRENKVARAKDIAERMEVTKSSVTGALKHLAGKGMIHYDPYSFVTLTGRGEARAERIVGRHRALSRFLRETLGLSAKAADDNACRMEHAVDDQALERLLHFARFLQRRGVVKGFRAFCRKYPLDASHEHEAAAEKAAPEGL